jgi:hypothetical protein
MRSIKIILIPSDAAGHSTSRADVAHSKTRLSIKSGVSHPATGDLEEYYFGRLTRYLGDSIESHLLTCDRCAQELQKLEEFVAVLSGAMQGTLVSRI